MLVLVYDEYSPSDFNKNEQKDLFRNGKGSIFALPYGNGGCS